MPVGNSVCKWQFVVVFLLGYRLVGWQQRRTFSLSRRTCWSRTCPVGRPRPNGPSDPTLQPFVEKIWATIGPDCSFCSQAQLPVLAGLDQTCGGWRKPRLERTWGGGGDQRQWVLFCKLGTFISLVFMFTMNCYNFLFENMCQQGYWYELCGCVCVWSIMVQSNFYFIVVICLI